MCFLKSEKNVKYVFSNTGLDRLKLVTHLPLFDLLDRRRLQQALRQQAELFHDVCQSYRQLFAEEDERLLCRCIFYAFSQTQAGK